MIFWVIFQKMAMNGMNRRGQGMPEEQMLLGETSKANIINSTANGKIGEFSMKSSCVIE